MVTHQDVQLVRMHSEMQDFLKEYHIQHNAGKGLGLDRIR